MNYQQGVGLSELLITLLLTSFMTIELMNHYINTKQQYRHIQTKLEQSIDIQLIADLIRDSSRRAGFTPCLGINHLVTLDQRGGRKALVALRVSTDGRPSLQINRMSEYFDTVLRVVNATNLHTTVRQTVRSNQSILIADCYHAEAHTVNQVKHTTTGQIITLAKPLAFVYQEPIYMGEWLEETYFIRGSLFYYLQHAEELTTLVHTMAVQLNKSKGQMLLHVILGLENKHQLTLDTMVRIP